MLEAAVRERYRLGAFEVKIPRNGDQRAVVFSACSAAEHVGPGLVVDKTGRCGREQPSGVLECQVAETHSAHIGAMHQYLNEREDSVDR